MLTEISRGPSTVRDILSAYVLSTFNTYLRLFRTQFDIDDEDLPDLDSEAVFKYERDTLDRWPQMVFSVSGARVRGRVDMDTSASEIFRTQYDVSIYTWVKAADVEADVLRMRDDYVTALRWCLSADLTLGDERVDWDIATLAENYSTATKAKGDRWLAAASTGFTLRMDENNLIVPLGVANQIITSAGKLHTVEPVAG